MASFILKAIKFPLAYLLLFVLTTGCKGGRNGRLPDSTGQPYEVVLEGDTDSIVTKILTADVPGLPQSEPLCNVINVKRGKMKGSYLMVRTRIVVDINPRHKGFSAKSSKDENASPQLVIRIKAKSAEQLRAVFYGKDNKEANKDERFIKSNTSNEDEKLNKSNTSNEDEELNKNAKQLRSTIDQSELKHLASIIKQNPEKQREVKRMFGLNMKIPAALDASKKAKGFLWLSNNAGSGMQNLVIFRLKGNGCSAPVCWSINRDETNKVLKRYMLGETNSMYMRLGERGLWEMKGDAMGGPYIMKVFPMSRGKIATPRSYRNDEVETHSYHGQGGKIDSRIVVIAFVYAPEMKKRNLTKQLEAVLSTISPE